MPADVPVAESLPAQWLLISLDDHGRFRPLPGPTEMSALTLLELALGDHLSLDDADRLRVRNKGQVPDGVLGLALGEIRDAEPAPVERWLGGLEVGLGGLPGRYVQALLVGGVLMPDRPRTRRRRGAPYPAAPAEPFTLADSGPRDRARQGVRDVLDTPAVSIRSALLAWMMGFDRALGVRGPRRHLFTNAERSLFEERMLRMRQDGIPALDLEGMEARTVVRAVLRAVATVVRDAVYGVPP